MRDIWGKNSPSLSYVPNSILVQAASVSHHRNEFFGPKTSSRTIFWITTAIAEAVETIVEATAEGSQFTWLAT